MKPVYWLIRREISSYLRSPYSYIVIASMLLITGLMFNAFAVGDFQRKSSEVLENFFYCTSGTTLLAAVLISMRLIAEEKQTGTLVLLMTSPLKDWQLIISKFISAMTLIAAWLLLTLYMPLLIMLHGKISFGHIATGYLGLFLLASCTIAMGLICSALAPNQLVAAVLSAALVTVFLLLWLLSRIASPPLDTVLSYLALHDKHFRPFMLGIISIQDIVFYLLLTYVALLLATRVLETRRWQ